MRERLSLRNRLPTTGMSPSTGTLSVPPLNSSFSRPPSTMIWPSSMTTVVSIELLSVVGPAGLAAPADDVGILLIDRHAHRAAFADLRLDPQREADVLALDGLERVGRAARGAGVGELPGDERHVLADHDLRFFVVERHQVRRRQHVAVGIRFEKAGQRRKSVEGADVPQHTQVQAAWRILGHCGEPRRAPAPPRPTA